MKNPKQKSKTYTLTQRDVIKGVLDRWVDQYPNMEYVFHDGRSVAAIKKQLESLDTDTCTIEDVDAIIGNSSWTELKCDSCDKPQTIMVMFDGGDYGRPDTGICEKCLTKANKLFKK